MPESPPPGWVPPESQAAPGGDGYGYAAPSFHQPGVVALRPLGLGDLFDGAFTTIRRNPTAMVGLAAIVYSGFLAVPVVVTLVIAATGHLRSGLVGTSGSAVGALAAVDTGAVLLTSYLGSLFGALATIVLNGLLVFVVSEAVLGRRTGITATWRTVRGRLPRLCVLTVLDLVMVVVLVAVPTVLGILVGVRAGAGYGLLVGLPLALVALVVGVLVQVRYFQLAPAALVLERTGVLVALSRAGRLSRGQFWRLFGILLLTSLVAGIAGEVIAIPLGLLGSAAGVVMPGTGGGLVLVFTHYLSQILVGAVTTPFTAAVVALQYVDQRIRKEGLDVALISASRTPGRDLG